MMMNAGVCLCRVPSSWKSMMNVSYQGPFIFVVHAILYFIVIHVWGHIATVHTLAVTIM